MKTCMVVVTSLFTLLLASAALASDLNATCKGTVIVTVGVDGPDKVSAIDATFTMKTKGKTSTFSLETKFGDPIKGTGKESGDPDKPWNFEGKDADGLAFKGNFRAVQAGHPKDTSLYIILELKNEKLLITGPMSCSLK